MNLTESGMTSLFDRFVTELSERCLRNCRNLSNVPKKLPLYISLFEDPVICVDHSRPQDAEQDDEDRKLVKSPQHVPGHVGHALLNLHVVVTFVLK